MNLKIQCPCGARYSFDVEPRDGRMPIAVQCPTCGADGTEAANRLIDEAAPIVVPVPVAVPVAQAAPVRDPAETRRAVQELLRQKKAAEQKSYRLRLGLLYVVVLAVAGYAGFWVWYYFSGSKPHVVYETTFGSQTEPSVQFIATNRFLVVDDQHATLHDVKADKDLWSTVMPVTSAPRQPQIFADGASIWLCLGDQIVQLDSASGSIKKTIPVDGALESFTPASGGILVISDIDATTRRALRIDPGTGDTASQDIVIPPPEKHLMPNVLPPNVQPTADVLTAQELDDKNKFSQPLDAMSSHVLPAGEGPVELRVKLLEPKVEWVQSIKPNPTTVNGETTATTTLFGVSDGVFNSIKRSETGGAKRIDESRYEVKVRRWNDSKPVEWTGESIGPPTFFALKSVDLVVCGKTLIALDKQNRFLFQANLSYPVADRYVTNHDAAIPPPAVEGPGGLYFADQGVLTAFALPGGEVRWRLTTIGVTKLQFDSAGSLYVDSSTASPQDIQYSDQITFDRAKPVLIKMDPQNGKILWQQEGVGYDCYISGKFLYATTANVGGMAIAGALGEALGNVPQSDEPTRFHLYRLNPATGQTMWDIYHLGAPQAVSFQENKFVLCYDHDVQVWRSLSF